MEKLKQIAPDLGRMEPTLTRRNLATLQLLACNFITRLQLSDGKHSNSTNKDECNKTAVKPKYLIACDSR